MSEPFSVAMCVYGGDNPEWFQEAMDSVLHQTAKPSEIVLVVDGPVSGTLNRIICTLENNALFRVVRLPQNVGHGLARKASVEYCTNELIALMDADDVSLPDRFEMQLAEFEKDPEISILGGIIREFLENEQNIMGYRIVPEDHVDICAYMKSRCPMNQVTVMFRKSDVMKAGGYLDWYCNEDYYLWLRMYLQGMKFRNIPDVLVNVRVNRDVYQRRGGWKYFVSEAKLQNYMLRNKIINPYTYLLNLTKRIVVQVLLPNKIRGWVFQKFARETL